MLTVAVAVVSVITNYNFHKSRGLNLEKFNGNLKNHFNLKEKQPQFRFLQHLEFFNNFQMWDIE